MGCVSGGGDSSSRARTRTEWVLSFETLPTSYRQRGLVRDSCGIYAMVGNINNLYASFYGLRLGRGVFIPSWGALDSPQQGVGSNLRVS